MTVEGTARAGLGRVIKALETRIVEADGSKQTCLPPERQLALELGISRATLREAIQRLVARGLLETRRGSGVFIRPQPPARMTAPWLQLIAEHAPVREDTLEFRLVFECAAAQFAAQRADATELEAMARIVERMERAVNSHDVEAEAKADVEFHAVVAMASHNLMLGHFHASVMTQLRDHIADNTFAAAQTRHNAHELALARLAQHKAIYHAIEQRDAFASSAAMHAHIEFVGRQFLVGGELC
ncbi:MAG TPA: FCD domain-containing protein [Pararobbsia sp.]|nr:FCD domain-containing protein [Pararobbsia sp.]